MSKPKKKLHGPAVDPDGTCHPGPGLPADPYCWGELGRFVARGWDSEVIRLAVGAHAAFGRAVEAQDPSDPEPIPHELDPSPQAILLQDLMLVAMFGMAARGARLAPADVDGRLCYDCGLKVWAAVGIVLTTAANLHNQAGDRPENRRSR